jgi:hypothetical protein
MLDHLQNTEYPKACGWYALTALTYNRDFLDYRDYFSHNVSRYVCVEKNWQQEVLWNCLFQLLPMPHDCWFRVLHQGILLLSDWNNHRVAITVHNSCIFVSDSKMPTIQKFAFLSQFLESQYVNTMYLVRLYKNDFVNAIMGLEVGNG